MNANKFKARRSNLTKLFQVTCRVAGMRIWVQRMEGPRPKHLADKITFKIRCDFKQL